MDEKRKRVAEDDPRRCQQVCGKYQCYYQAVDGSTYCCMHAGNQNNKNWQAAEKTKMHNYRLACYRARVEEFAENPHVKSLREEVGVLRLLLEETINKCQTTSDLMIYSNKISGLVIQIEKLVTSCNNIETKTGQLLDRSVVIKLVEQMMGIINNYIDDPDLLNQLSDDMGSLMTTQYTNPLSTG